MGICLLRWARKTKTEGVDVELALLATDISQVNR